MRVQPKVSEKLSKKFVKSSNSSDEEEFEKMKAVRKDIKIISNEIALKMKEKETVEK